MVKQYDPIRRIRISQEVYKKLNVLRKILQWSWDGTLDFLLEREEKQREIVGQKLNTKVEIVGQRRFSLPSLDEVRAYCLERNNRVDPEQWYNFYESKGWMIGKNKMKDWRAAVRIWERSTLSSVPKNIIINNPNV